MTSPTDIHQYLTSVFPVEDELKYFLNVLAVANAGLTTHKLHFIVGQASSGKTVLSKLIADTFGTNYCEISQRAIPSDDTKPKNLMMISAFNEAEQTDIAALWFYYAKDRPLLIFADAIPKLPRDPIWDHITLHPLRGDFSSEELVDTSSLVTPLQQLIASTIPDPHMKPPPTIAGIESLARIPFS